MLKKKKITNYIGLEKRFIYSISQNMSDLICVTFNILAANQAAVAAAATAVATDPLQQAYTGMQQYAGQFNTVF